MRKFCLVLMALSLAVTAYSQKNGVIRGVACDTISKLPVRGQ